MNNNYEHILNKLAMKAYKQKEVPVGAIVVDGKGKVIGKGYNNRQKKHDILGHAEIIALKQASKRKKDWRLDDCILYSTLEPCELCKKIIDLSRIKQVYYYVSKTSNINNKITKYNKIKSDKIDEKIIEKFFKNMR